jgi:hypothetical protein
VEDREIKSVIERKEVNIDIIMSLSEMHLPNYYISSTSFFPLDSSPPLHQGEQHLRVPSTLSPNLSYATTASSTAISRLATKLSFAFPATITSRR